MQDLNIFEYPHMNKAYIEKKFKVKPNSILYSNKLKKPKAKEE